jgi:hypothetical protein
VNTHYPVFVINLLSSAYASESRHIAWLGSGLIHRRFRNARKERIMNRKIRLWRGITVGGLSLALLGAIGLPVSARAGTNNNCGKTCSMAEHRAELRALHKTMLAQARAEDAALARMVADLNKAPEAKKADLEAAILTKLVAQHHQMLGEWESLHAKRMELHKERMQLSQARMSGSSNKHAVPGHQVPTAQN